jgi:RNA 3'-terminal phosphate cyclase
MIEIRSNEVTEIFSTFGQVGLSAEKVASIAARDAHEYDGHFRVPAGAV